MVWRQHSAIRVLALVLVSSACDPSIGGQAGGGGNGFAGDGGGGAIGGSDLTGGLTGCPEGGVVDAAGAEGAAGSDGAVAPDAMASEYGLTQRVINTTCDLPGVPDDTPALDTERVFPSLTFSSPVYLTHPPDGTDRIFVVEQTGRIKVFPNDNTVQSATEFLDLTAKIRCCGEQGLLSMAFHPSYAQNGYFYVYYSGAGTPRRSVIARYQVSSDPNVANSASELILLEIPLRPSDDNHNGGQLFFGWDNFLYLATGDGGSAGDPDNVAQNLTSPLGKMLRIDVDNPDSGKNYGVPSDNPFFGMGGGALGEIWAYGLRNPWRFSVDRVTGTMWLADVGQGEREEVDIVRRGANYGWRLMEGELCYVPSSGCNDGSLTLPLATYPHSGGDCSISGGFVYRGSRLPELYGAYVVADYCTGIIRLVRYDGQTATLSFLYDSPYNISGFGEDRDGEIYILDHSGGGIYRFHRTGASTPGLFPRTLTDTGCFSNLVARSPAPGLVPYEVNSPLWSDGTAKRRWIALPGSSTIGYQASGAWDFPDGTILVKEFALDERSNAACPMYRALETRFLVKRSGSWKGYSYKWNDEQTEAFLIDSSAEQIYAVQDPQNPGQTVSYTHYFPSRSECGTCHTLAAGGTLGLQTGQLNRDHLYDNGVRDNQLRAMEHIGLFSSALPGVPSSLPRLPDPADTTQSLEARARSYLHGNCAQCHLPGGIGATLLDLRYETAFADTQTCDQSPQGGDLGVSGARIIKHGVASESILYLRMSRRGQNQMPPLATLLVDTRASDVVRDYINSLASCP